MCEPCNPVHLTRRSVLGAGVATLAAATLTASPSILHALAAEGVTPEEALQRLRDGNARYAANTAVNKDYSAGRAARALSQKPFASIVSCADSRVAPELAFDQGPGALFVVRLAGNFVNEDGLASLEYGAAFLGTPLIMVLGHSSCGAVAATIKVVEDGSPLPGHLPSLTNAIRPAVEAAAAAKPDDLLAAATVENVRQNVERLQTAEPILGEMVEAGTVKVVGGVYDIATGTVTLV
jgi:carbonic anhydrase